MNNYQQQQQQQQQQQHQHALHQMQRQQNVHQQFPPQHTQYVYSDPTAAPAPRTDGFTVFRTTHGDYLMNNYNNYELFSNNAFIPPHHAMQQPPHSQQPPPPPPPPSQEHAFYHANNLTMGDRYMTDANNTNFINSLVDNWIPNMTGMPFGEYTPFGESPLPPQNMSSTHNDTITTTTNTAPIINANEIRDDLTTKDSSISAPIVSNDHQDMKNGNICNENMGNIKINNQMSADCSKETFIQNNLHAINNAQASCTNGNFQCDNTNPIKPTSDVKKPRMVAEVKPMRMSYSDVLSKNVFIKDDLSEAHTFNNRNSSGSNNFANALSNANPLQKPSKTDKSKNLINASDKKSANIHDDIKDYSGNFKGTKTASNSTSAQNLTGIKSSSSFDSDTKPTDMDGKQSKKKTNANVTNGKSTNRNPKNASTEFLSKRRSQTDLNAPPTKDESDKNSSANNGYFYNITKNEPTNADKPFPSYTKANQPRKSASNKTFSNVATTSSRSTLPRTEKSTVYQQKRSNKSRKNNTYEFVLKMAHTWFNYMLFFFKWLIALVADVFILSVGIIWDHFSSVYDYSCQMFSSLRSELTNNSGRPYAYFISLWQKFDNKFNKDSKWAIWRRLFSKKKPPETIPDYYKNGRLPQTGDEAMYSLLNCKGKDAYSILGVQSDCSQEQIRKHYKKIAVLVHPDKNKQPGAEEAFKILQRAFELIGEPENRKSYDQGVAEALNAEKAWSELNDLLKQLQTKIAEAVNTIRCSSCGLRHPRKPTGRPHYAARQCNTCKIRHTAREGDIWAETSFFGLRWKYLALMEGKVLDITEWANCQKGALSHLQPNSHIVQYRIVLGGQQQQQSQQPHYQQEKERLKREQTTEPSLDEFLDNLYSGQNPQNSNAGGNGTGSRRRNRKN